MTRKALPSRTTDANDVRSATSEMQLLSSVLLLTTNSFIVCSWFLVGSSSTALALLRLITSNDSGLRRLPCCCVPMLVWLRCAVVERIER